MSGFKKFIAFLCALVMLSGLSVALTAAYLTDRDSEANIFTVGDVTIDLLGKFDDEPVLLPGIPVDDPASVKNIGKNEAWIWATAAYPKALDPVVQLDTDATGVWSKLNTATAEKDGAEYSLVTYLHNAPVAPGAETAPFLLRAALDSRVDIAPDGGWYLVEGGSTTPIGWNSKDNGAPVLYVSAYAIQTEGFTTAADGYNAYRTQWGDKGTEWGEVTVQPDDGTEEEEGVPSLPTSVELGDTGLVLSCEDGITDDDYSWDGGYLYIYTAKPVVLSMDEGAPPTETSIYLDAANADLTIKGLNLTAVNGIIAEKPATLRVKDTNTISGSNYGIYAWDSLQITGGGTLNLKDYSVGIGVPGSAVTIGCAVTMTNVDYLGYVTSTSSIKTVDGGTINGQPYPVPSLPTSVKLGDSGLVLSCEDGISADDYSYEDYLSVRTSKPLVLSMAEGKEEAVTTYISVNCPGADLTFDNLNLRTAHGVRALTSATYRIKGTNKVSNSSRATIYAAPYVSLDIVGDGSLELNDTRINKQFISAESGSTVTIGCTVTTTDAGVSFAGSIETVDGGTINGKPYPEPAPSLPTSVEIGGTGLVLSCEDGITDDDYLWYGNGLNISTDKPVVLSMAEDAEQAEVSYIQFATAGADLTIENLTLNTSDGIIFLYPGTLRVSGSNTIRSYIGITSNGGDLQIVGDGTLVFKDGFTGLYASNGTITVGCTITTTEVVNPFITESGSIETVDGGTINGQSYPAP